MQEIICIDGKFPMEVLAFYKEKGIKYPKQDGIYSIREMRREFGKQDMNNNIGVLLNEINNPKVECPHPVLGTVLIEPSFSSKRFTTLLGDQILFNKVDEKVKV